MFIERWRRLELSVYSFSLSSLSIFGLEILLLSCSSLSIFRLKILFRSSWCGVDEKFGWNVICGDDEEFPCRDELAYGDDELEDDDGNVIDDDDGGNELVVEIVDD